MNKVLKVLSAAALSAVVAVSAFGVVSAAGINNAEQKILNELNTTVNLGGNATKLPVRYVNQAENYFQTIDITDAEAERIVTDIEAAKKYLESTGVKRFGELSNDQIDEVVRLSNVASGEIQVTLKYNKVTKEVTAYDKDGNIIGSATKPGDDKDGDKKDDDKKGDDKKGDDKKGDDKKGDDDKKGTDDNKGNDVIKTTGFDVPSVTFVAGLGIILVSAAGVYLLKTSKKDEI